MSWLKQSKGECPQCKKPSVELRALDFDTTTALLSSNTEIRADRQAAEEQRRRMLVEFTETWHSVLEELKTSTQRRQDAEKQAEKAKLERRELQEQEIGDEAMRVAIVEELDKVLKRCAMTRFHLDSHQTQISKPPALAPRQDDEDAQNERRKLHQAQQAGLRASDRGKDLHLQLIFASNREVELQSLARKFRVAADEADAIVGTLRLQADHLRKQLNEIQDESLDFSSTRSDVSSVPLKTPSPGVRSLQSGSPSSPSSPAVAKVLNVLHRRPATPNRSAAGEPKRTVPEDDEDRLLFGGPAKLQRKGSGGFGKATVKPLQRTPSTQVVTTKPKKKSNLKSLFDPF